MLLSIYMIAITAEAMSGALAAGRRNMDLFGVAVIAFFTALGGGTIRDILLATILIARFMRHLNQLFLVLDAIGLVAFTVIGCNVALQLGYDTVVVVMAGITTGIFGGIIRDIMCNRTPLVLRHELYASVSLVVALLYVTLLGQALDENVTLLAAFSLGLLFRMAAIRWRLSLPVFRYPKAHWE